MRMQVILDSSFARPGSAPIWGGKKGEFRDWSRAPDDIWNPSLERDRPEKGWLRGLELEFRVGHLRDTIFSLFPSSLS